MGVRVRPMRASRALPHNSHRREVVRRTHIFDAEAYINGKETQIAYASADALICGLAKLLNNYPLDYGTFEPGTDLSVLIDIEAVVNEPPRTPAQINFLKALQDLQDEVRFPIGKIKVTSYVVDGGSPFVEGVEVIPRKRK